MLARYPEIILGLLYLLAVCGVLYAMGPWELIGEQRVTESLDHETIAVSPVRGGLRSLKLLVRNAPVSLRRIVVHFGNGADQEAELAAAIPAGGESREIDLRGGNEVVRSVDLWFDAGALARREAIIRIVARM